MNFIFAWLISSTAVFVLEIILMVGGRLIGNFFNFADYEEFSFSKLYGKIIFSTIMGLILVII